MKLVHRAQIGSSLILLSFSILILIPIVYALQISFSGKGLADYVYLLQRSTFFINFGNSALIVSISLVCIVTICLTSAYAFSKLQFPLKSVLYLAMLMMLMLPPAAILVPLFHTNKVLGLLNSYWGVIGPYIALFAPFNLLIMKNFFDEIPHEIMEAGIIDGANEHTIFFYIILPLSVPIVIVVVIWVFIMVWNEYLLAMVFLTNPAKMTLTVLPNQFLQAYRMDIPKLFAALILMMLPILMVYFILQRYIPKGLTAGAIKA